MVTKSSNGTLVLGPDNQIKAIKIFIGLSVLAHFGVIFIPALFVPRPIVSQESAFDVQLMTEFDSTIVAKAPESLAKEDQEALTDPKMLPQLPKRFEIKEPEEKKVAAIDPERIEKAAPLKEANAEENKAGEEEAKKKEKELIEITKKNAFERLLREQDRQKKKEGQKEQEAAKKTADEIKKLRKNREKEISELNKGGLNAAGTNGLDQHPYVTQMRIWIKRHYNLPEIYVEQFVGKPDPTVEIMLDADGNLSKVALVQSSTDTVLDQLAIKTIEDSSPFPKPPREFVGKIIHVPFNH